MATGLPLDLDNLLAPIPGDNPAGNESAMYELRGQLEELRKEVNPDDFDADDPARPTERKAADWAGIERLTREALATKSKDLRLGGYLVEALLVQYGFPGLQEGIKLLRGLIEQCWDRSYPVIEEGDVEVRNGVFNALNDPTSRNRTPFPNQVRQAPVLTHGKARFSYQDWEDSQRNGDAELAEKYARAAQAVSPEEATKTVDSLNACVAEVQGLAKALEEKIGPDATNLGNVTKALQDCMRALGGVGKSGKTGPGEDGDGDNVNGEPDQVARGPLKSRADCYRQMSEAARMLQQLEPHSPVPYLVQRAVELGALPFPQLIRALIRDATVLSELTREMGIKTEAETETQSTT